MSSQSVASMGSILLWAMIGFAFIPESRADEIASAEVLYTALDTVYLNAGALEGLHRGDVLTVERSGVQLSRIEIIHVGDHTAAGRLHTRASAPPRQGDRALFSRPTKKPAAHDSSPPEKPSVETAKLAALWNAANARTPPVLIRYTGTDGGDVAAAVHGHAEIDYHLYADFKKSSLLRNEQNFSFWTHGENLGIEGLDVRLRGRVLARYDGKADHYLEGRRAIPLIRELAVSYSPKDRAIFGAAGRFSPRMPQASIVDGVEMGADLQSFSISAFGGLKPKSEDLVPTIHRQTFGALVSFRPDFGRARFETDEGVTAEIRDGKFSRTAVSIDNRFSVGAKLFASQIATFDFLGADGRGQPVSDFAVSLLGLDVGYHVSKKSTVDFRGRYNEQTVFVEDVKTLSQEWIDALRGRRHGRAEVGLLTRAKKERQWRPFVFGLGDFDNDIETAYAGAGFQLITPSLLSTRTSMLTSFDVGVGTGQLSNLNVSFTTPIIVKRLQLRSGLFNTWQRAQDTTVNTLRHLLFLVLTGQITDGLDIFADLSAAYNHAPVRTTYPFGGQMRFELGATYRW